MKLKTTELKALGWYAKDKQLKPQLSTPPKMYFTDKDGAEVIDNLFNIVALYKAWNEEDKKERARQKRAVEARNKAMQERARITW